MLEMKTNMKIFNLLGQDIVSKRVIVLRDPYNHWPFIKRGERIFIKDWDATNRDVLVFREQLGGSIDDWSPRHVLEEEAGWQAAEAAILQKRKDKKLKASEKDNPSAPSED